jgi:hypothetical protein
MASCTGCGVPLGLKKYKFNKFWRVPGSFCKSCMLKVGQDWEKHGKVTLPMKACDLCQTEFFFLNTAWQGKKQKHFCDVCHKVAASGVLPDKSRGDMKQKVPIPMLIIGGLGAVMMVLGMVFTLTGPKDPEGEMSIVNILFGAFTTAAGFMLVRRTINNRKLLLGNV